MSLFVCHLELKEANDFVRNHHRHHKKVQGHRFSIGAVNKKEELLGVAIVGRPVSRNINYKEVVEVTRLCTNGSKNVCSFLYAACARCARELGYKKIQTYILDTEDGTSLVAAGWSFEYETSGGSWNCKARSREDKHPTVPKKLYSKSWS